MSRIFTEQGQLRLLDSETIAIAGENTSSVIDLKQYNPNGYITLQLKTASGGAATLQVEMLCSINGDDYVLPDGASDVVSAHAVGDGLYAVEPGMSVRYLKLKFTGAVAEQTVDAWLLVQ